MVATPRSKPIDKPEVLRRLAALLKKTYSGAPPRKDLPVLETLLFAVCLEDATVEQAESAYQHLLKSFPDLNEARVSSITELQHVMSAQSDPAWRALRVKSILQHAFDAHYAFELEGLKRKTTELAIKSLGKIPALSWFVRGYALQQALESHALPLDSRMLGVLAWLAVVEPEASAEEAGEMLRSHVRKADAPLLVHLLRSLAHDPKRNRVFQITSKGIDCAATADEGLHRLEVLLSKGPASVPKAQPRPQPAPVKTSSAKSGSKSEGSAGAKSVAVSTEPSLNGSRKPTGAKSDRPHSDKLQPERPNAERPQPEKAAEAARSGLGKTSSGRPAVLGEAGVKNSGGKPGIGKGVSGKAPVAAKDTASAKLPSKASSKGPVARKETGKLPASAGKGKLGSVRSSSPSKAAAKVAGNRAATGKSSAGTKAHPKRG